MRRRMDVDELVSEYIPAGKWVYPVLAAKEMSSIVVANIRNIFIICHPSFTCKL